MQPAEKDEYKTPAYESYGNYWWDYPADQNSPEDSLIGQRASPVSPDEPITDDAEIKIIYHSGFREHGPSGKKWIFFLKTFLIFI